MKQYQLLVVEDDADISDLIQYHLRKEGFQVLTAARGNEALTILNDESVDLAILDIMLPELSGTEICRWIRNEERLKSIPVMFLSARGDIHDKMFGFELGADDYLVKPFSPQELVARVKAILKRSMGANSHYTIGELEVYFDSHMVKIGGKRVHLRPREFKVLQLLIESGNKTVSRNYLLEKAWGMDSRSGSRSVDIVINRLREKIRPYDRCVRTVVGFGYQWDPIQIAAAKEQTVA